ncbi:MAG: hypothetical protein A3G91_06435 [Omnitrophica WOR_2 bacterium RIFCSPLOWO2_12_FULL_50_9]|nr:MAG: hypothetical protein A3D87_06935 [Omnitrophica WOR_2 bacterium RIFCSPHIGHO2_02_FULL_50_17]OGX40255.1 MAG: hypothetical protein A3G91_06435 [Omnitrophica WOR_2 bacterium RIFCSPLOWO2_12_FULL_50_9]
MGKGRDNVLYEVRLNIGSRGIGVGEILEGFLISLGVRPEDIVESTQKTKPCLAVYFKSYRASKSLARRLMRLKLKYVAVKIRRLLKKDWLNASEIRFKPFSLTRSLRVVPSWLKGRYRPPQRQHPLYINTSMAFGSGLHETTRFMAALIERCRGRFESFFDIGTGTGILSLVALCCGARKVRAIDFNPDCIKVARDNFRINSYKARGLAAGDIHHYPEKRQYDFVAANLVTHNLVKAGRTLVCRVKPGQYLAVSGVSLENFRHFRESFRKYPLRCLKVIKGKEWAAFLFKKNDSARIRGR